MGTVTNVICKQIEFHSPMTAFERTQSRLFPGLMHPFHKPGKVKVVAPVQGCDPGRHMNPLAPARRVTDFLSNLAGVIARDVRSPPRESISFLCIAAGENPIASPVPGFRDTRAMVAGVAEDRCDRIHPIATGARWTTLSPRPCWLT